MFYGILIFIHVIVCIGLIGIVLIQAGRGGGLSESFSGAESIFGTKTNAFLTRATSIFAVIFFITCLSLAFLSKQRSKSLLEGKKIPAQTENAKQEETKTATETKTNTQAPSQTENTKPQEDKTTAEPKTNTQTEAQPQSQPQSSTVTEKSQEPAAQ